MIPFFRKIRKKMADDNKPLKYMRYAIGEILLVVIGILIALSINNWNNERKNREIERYYLNSIKNSIKLSQNELNRVIKDAKLTSICADTLYLLLAHKKYELMDPIFIDSLLYNAGDYSLISLNDDGLQEILNTGSLNLIQDERIRVVLASWNERMHKIRKHESESEYLARNFQKYLMNFIDYSRWELDSLNSFIIPKKKHELLTDPILTNYLNDIYYVHRGMYNMYSQEKIVLDSLKILINQSITE